MIISESGVEVSAHRQRGDVPQAPQMLVTVSLVKARCMWSRKGTLVPNNESWRSQSDTPTQTAMKEQKGRLHVGR